MKTLLILLFTPLLMVVSVTVRYIRPETMSVAAGTAVRQSLLSFIALELPVWSIKKREAPVNVTPGAHSRVLYTFFNNNVPNFKIVGFCLRPD